MRLGYIIFTILVLLASGEQLVAATLEGSLKKWQPLSLSFVGPFRNEQDSNPNPFLDYRLIVSFTSDASGETYSIPGFFAGDGDGGASGDTWRVMFNPDEVGEWNWVASFEAGPGLAVAATSESGLPLPADGESGSFQVSPRDPDAEGFLSGGRLLRSGTYYPVSDSGYWVKLGLNSPENFLGYSGFDNTPNASHSYAPHVQHWRAGDPDWDSPDRAGANDGRGIIGALNYIADQGLNSIYFLPSNIGADGKDTWPYSSTSINREGSASNDNLHFDLSKLEQWNVVFDHAQSLGIYLHFVLSDKTAANKNELDNATLGIERKLFYRELIARFAHHNALQWNISEEYNLGLPLPPSVISEFASYIYSIDPYRHPVTVHNHGNTYINALGPFVGQDWLGVMSIQTWQEPDDISFAIEYFRETTAAAQAPVPVNVDESIGIDQMSAILYRKRAIWDALLSGGGHELFIRYADSSVEDFAQFSEVFAYSKIAREFVQTQLPFNEMAPADDLSVGGATVHGGPEVFAKVGEVYAVYLPDASLPVQLNVASDGSFQKRWFNPRTGLYEGAVETIVSPGLIDLGVPPHSGGDDWVILIELEQGPQPPTVASQDLTTGVDEALPFVLDFADADGPGPYTFTVVSGPANGSLSTIGADGSVTYLPDSGFEGSDSFRWRVNDGVEDSAEATVSIIVGGSLVTLIEDDFGGSDRPVIGGGWTELEAPGAVLSVISGALEFTDTSDVANRPQATKSFASVSGGLLEWQFDFNWSRIGNEGVYAVMMQLGDSALMQADDPTVGVGVDLIWSVIGGVHQTLGYRSGDGSVVPLTGVSGPTQIKVQANLDNKSYSVLVDGVLIGSGGIPFADSVTELNTLRFLTDGVNEANFAGRTFDNVRIDYQSGGGGNTAPQASDLMLETLTDQALAIELDALDVDGDLLTYSIVDAPQFGSLSSDLDGDKNVVYTPQFGFSGADSFTYVANDGSVDSNQALVEILVDGGNEPPTVASQDLTTGVDEALPFVLDFADADGPGPYTFTVVSGPANGSLSTIGADGSVTYLPDSGFEGSDSFRWRVNDGVEDSAEATVSIIVGGSLVTLIEDDFGGSDRPVIGGGWTELEAPGAVLSVISGALEFTDTSDVANRPQATKSFASVSGGLLEWQFDFNWSRIGNEGVYAVMMQLGDSALMQADDPTVGVGVDLIWSVIGGVHQTLGYRSGDGSVVPLTGVSGPTQIKVQANLDNKSYSVLVDGVLIGSGGIPFADSVTELNTLRFLTDGVNEANFAGRTFDNVRIDYQSGGGGNTAPQASDLMLETLTDQALAIELDALDVDGDLLTYSIVDAPQFGSLSSDLDGDKNVVYTPQFGFSGADSFTYVANDGSVDSNQALVEILVDGGNEPPTVASQDLTTGVDEALPFVLDFADADGPGPYTFTVVSGPANGSLSTIGADGSVTYLPDSGFEGSDSFRWRVNDGVEDSAEATVSIIVGGSLVTLIEDDFGGSDRPVIGGGWTELEAPGAVLSVISGALEFTDTSDVANRPQATKSFASVSGGLLEWQFDFNWSRIGNEGVYAVMMQLGDSALMQADDPTVGVGVDLIWSVIGGVHQTLGYRSGDGSVVPLTGVSGPTQIKVQANLDNKSYSVLVDGVLIGSGGIPFADSVTELNTLRFLTDGVNEANFAGRTFDNVRVTYSSP